MRHIFERSISRLLGVLCWKGFVAFFTVYRYLFMLPLFCCFFFKLFGLVILLPLFPIRAVFFR
uniref:Ovule protein n=1 Tax=Parascaris univalens TaxID=6257 RepID=A0A914ZS89_PARUN